MNISSKRWAPTQLRRQIPPFWEICVPRLHRSVCVLHSKWKGSEVSCAPRVWLMTSPNSSPNPAVAAAEIAASQPLAFDDTRTAFAHRSTRDLRRARWMFGLIGAPAMVALGAKAVRLALAIRLPLNWILRPVFDYFCGGEDIQESLDTAVKLSQYGVKTILDYSAEGQTGEGALNAAHDQIMSAIQSAKGPIDRRESHGVVASVSRAPNFAQRVSMRITRACCVWGLLCGSGSRFRFRVGDFRPRTQTVFLWSGILRV